MDWMTVTETLWMNVEQYAETLVRLWFDIFMSVENY